MAAESTRNLRHAAKWIAACLAGMIGLTVTTFAQVRTAAADSLAKVVDSGDLVALRARLSSGANPNEPDDSVVEGWTPLIAAAYSGNVEAARLLLDAEAGINAKTQFGKTALDVALAGGKPRVAELLRSRGAKAGPVTGLDSLIVRTSRGFIQAPREVIQKVRAKLEVSMGLLPLGNDSATISALKRFQNQNGLAVTGELDQRTLEVLGVTCVPCGLSKPTLEALIAGIHEYDFDTRHYAVSEVWKLGADGVPAIPALMDVLVDDRNNPEYPQKVLLINGHNAASIADFAEEALKRLIPASNGFGFEYASRALLARPKPDLSRARATVSREEELAKNI